jgi:hypothetical protein
MGANGERSYRVTSQNCGDTGDNPQSDVDGNRGADLVLTTDEGSAGSAGMVLLSTWQGFLSPARWWNGAGFGWGGVTPLVGDVNGDRKADYVYLTNEGANGTKAFVALSTGSGLTAPQLWWNGTGYGYGGIKASLGDVDGNRGADLILTTDEGATGSAGMVLLSTWQGFLPPARWWNGTGFGWVGVTPLVGDVNGDRKADYVYLTNEGANGTKAFVALSTGSGLTAPQLWWNGTGYGYGGIKASLGDVDGNRGADLILTTDEGSAGSAGMVLLSTWQGFLPPARWWNGAGFGWGGVTPLVGDVNGDRKADYVYLTDEGSAGTKAFVALSTGSGLAAPQLWWNGTGYGYHGIKAGLR